MPQHWHIPTHPEPIMTPYDRSYPLKLKDRVSLTQVLTGPTVFPYIKSVILKDDECEVRVVHVESYFGILGAPATSLMVPCLGWIVCYSFSNLVTIGPIVN